MDLAPKKKKKQWIQAAQETKAPHKGQTGTQQKQKPDGKKLQLKAARAMACNAIQTKETTNKHESARNEATIARKLIKSQTAPPPPGKLK